MEDESALAAEGLQKVVYSLQQQVDQSTARLAYLNTVKQSKSSLLQSGYNVLQSFCDNTLPAVTNCSKVALQADIVASGWKITATFTSQQAVAAAENGSTNRYSLLISSSTCSGLTSQQHLPTHVTEQQEMQQQLVGDNATTTTITLSAICTATSGDPKQSTIVNVDILQWHDHDAIEGSKPIGLIPGGVLELPRPSILSFIPDNSNNKDASSSAKHWSRKLQLQILPAGDENNTSNASAAFNAVRSMIQTQSNCTFSLAPLDTLPRGYVSKESITLPQACISLSHLQHNNNHPVYVIEIETENGWVEQHILSEIHDGLAHSSLNSSSISLVPIDRDDLLQSEKQPNQSNTKLHEKLLAEADALEHWLTAILKDHAVVRKAQLVTTDTVNDSQQQSAVARLAAVRNAQKAAVAALIETDKTIINSKRPL